ncbi:MAG: AzlC family ABC transporter permease [Oscillospiraceae bacterium]
MKNIYYVCRLIAPVYLSYMFVGITYGILRHQAGYSAEWAVLSSLFIYAGTMQIVMESLLISGVPIWIIALMTLLVNFRHIFYGLGFMES